VLLVAGLYSVLWGKSKELPPPPTPCPDHASAIIYTVKQGSATSDGDMNMDGVKLEEKRIKLDSQV
jgi:hypothetical protein